MRALFLDKRLGLLNDYPDPRPRGGESIVRVRMAGICGTDLELARGYMAYRGVPGHEFVGEVLQSSRADLVGRRVAGEINAGCGRCDMCARDLARHCPNRTVLGILGRDGAFADMLQLPDENLVPIPDSLSDRHAVFVEPLAAAYEILEQTRIARDRSIVVLGDGRLGALVAMALAGEGYNLVIAGHHREKLDLLCEFGLKTALESELQPGFDVVVDCTGSPAGMTRALGLVRPRGTLILKSTAARSTEMNLAPAVINEITVIGSRCGRFARAIRALSEGRIDPLPLISAVFPMERAREAIEAAAVAPNFKILLQVS